MIRGISGGQKKRVTTGIFMDKLKLFITKLRVINLTQKNNVSSSHSCSQYVSICNDSLPI